jgi:hypothetical protein
VSASWTRCGGGRQPDLAVIIAVVDLVIEESE